MDIPHFIIKTGIGKNLRSRKTKKCGIIEQRLGVGMEKGRHAGEEMVSMEGKQGTKYERRI